MIALQVSHPLQIPWTMLRSLVKINLNQFSPVTDLLVSFTFSSPVGSGVVFVGSLSCSLLLDVPVMQLPYRNQTLPKQVELVLEVATKGRNGLCNQ